MPSLPPRSFSPLVPRVLGGIRDLWRAALEERATPGGIASSIAIGVFSGCTPFIGFHAGVALAAATILRVNRLWALVGSRVSFFLVLPWIVLAEIETSHRLRMGAWAPLSAANAMAHKEEWLLDWFLGSLPVGALLALAAGGLAYGLARRRETLRLRTRAPAPTPSSGSPPSD